MKTKSTREKWFPIASYFQCNLINSLQLNKVHCIANSSSDVPRENPIDVYSCFDQSAFIRPCLTVECTTSIEI